jgi:hypothetical protein
VSISGFVAAHLFGVLLYVPMKFMSNPLVMLAVKEDGTEPPMNATRSVSGPSCHTMRCRRSSAGVLRPV